MLRYMLDGHPQINCHGEVFKRRGLRRFLKKDNRVIGLTPLYSGFQDEYNRLTEQEFIAIQLLSSEDDLIRAVGFKFKTEEYFDPAFHHIGNYLKGRTDVRVVHLKRRDLLSQYISHQIVRKRKGVTVAFSKKDAAKPYKMKISISDLQKFLVDVTRREAEIEREFIGHNIFECYYEQIVSIHDNSIQAMQRFLGVTPQLLEKKTVKLISDHYDIIRNKDEVLSCLISSPFEERLSKDYLDT